MPPKAIADPAKPAISNDAKFLAICIKHAKEKMVADFDSVATEMGMSKGGAANKFRGLMKTFEEDGVGSATNSTTSNDTSVASKVKTALKRKVATPAATDDDEAASAGEPEPVIIKKAKTAADTKKGIAKPAAKKGKGAPAKGKAKSDVKVKEATDTEAENGDDDGAKKPAAKKGKGKKANGAAMKAEVKEEEGSEAGFENGGGSENRSVSTPLSPIPEGEGLDVED